jgi:hypothetical protein
MANPLKFVQEVRSETSKVTWPTRNEVAVKRSWSLFWRRLLPFSFLSPTRF